jgi:hypothetical protein
MLRERRKLEKEFSKSCSRKQDNKSYSEPFSPLLIIILSVFFPKNGYTFAFWNYIINLSNDTIPVSSDIDSNLNP